MPIEGVYSVEEKRALVYEYLQVPHGRKGAFLESHGLKFGKFRRWRDQVFADTLEHGLVPRSGGLMSVEESGALQRLLKENAALREELAARDTTHEHELAQRDEELARQRRAVDALGKAIEILHPSGDSKSSESDPPAARPPTQE